MLFLCVNNARNNMIKDTNNSSNPIAQTPKLNTFLSFFPIIILILCLVFVVKVFDTSAMEGASQIALLVASAVCVFIGMLLYKIPWQSFEDAIKENISNVGSAIVICFSSVR